MCYNKYQIHVSATILAIIRLYSSYQVAVQCMWCILGRRDLVCSSSGMNSDLIDRLQITEIIICNLSTVIKYEFMPLLLQTRSRLPKIHHIHRTAT